MKKRSSKKIPAHYGMSDYYNYFIENNPNINISRSKYNKIITQFNDFLVDHIINDLSVKLPTRLGMIEIIKKKITTYIKDGKLINNKPVDWKATNDLWKMNSEAKDKKILIRHENKKTGGFTFRIIYNKNNALYKNKSVYFFKPTRYFSRSLNSRIENYSKDKYDTYIK